MKNIVQPDQRYGRLVVLKRGNRHYREHNGVRRKDGWMWLCRCDCGKALEVRSHSLRPGATSACVRSCGCLQTENAKRLLPLAMAAWKLPEGESVFRQLLSQYRRAARKRNISFCLTSDEVRKLFSGVCFYCGCPPLKVRHSQGRNGSLTWNGIDRIDPKKGYEISNVVTACAACNLAKQSMTGDEFIELAKRITENQRRSS